MARYGVFYNKLSDSWLMCIDGRTDRPVKNFKTQGEAMRYASALNDADEALLCVVCGKEKVTWPFSTCDKCITKAAAIRRERMGKPLPIKRPRITGAD